MNYAERAKIRGWNKKECKLFTFLDTNRLEVDSIPLTNVTFLIFSKVDTWPTKGELEFREKGKGSKGQRVFFQAESDSAGWHS